MVKKWVHLLLLLLPVCLFAQQPVGQPTENFDIHLLDKINPDTLRSSYWKTTSNSAYWMPVAVTLGQLGYGFVANDKLAKRYGVETAISVSIGQLMSAGIKHIVNRERPYESWPEIIHPQNYGTGPSFPSGHTTAAFSTAASLAFSRKQWFVTVPFTLWAGSVGYSRMYLGRHYPTDVLGGLIIGVASGLLGHWVTGRLYHD